MWIIQEGGGGGNWDHLLDHLTCEVGGGCESPI